MQVFLQCITGCQYLQLTVVDVDGVVESILTAADNSHPTVPMNLGSYIWQTEHEDLQVNFQE